MRFASIRSMDISDGEGIGVAIYTQGCPFKCYNCHNPETWDYDGGTEFTKEHIEKIISLMKPDYINHFSCLGGEPLIERNLKDLACLFKRIKEMYTNKKIWVWSGYEWEALYKIKNPLLNEVLNYVDVLVAGPYIDSLRDLTLKWRGSSNQIVIDMKKTATKIPVLYCN